ncbi:ABC transporter ATP-binding protein [Thalassotalea aquiviva]|uniref:ABC transporter ATP-binding protein n=1 Tax=Thalassotalea aquiviva TaxID=3242415 RepID=UPI00352BC58B
MSIVSKNPRALIEVQGVDKYFADKQALDNVNFSLTSGSPIALVGPNGAGKTTLFSILCGYIKPTRGTVRLFGHQPGHQTNLGKLAALPQDAQLDPRFSVGKQLAFYAQLQNFSRKQAHVESERVLSLVGLGDTFKEKPGALSHGMRKRLTIAQTLIGEPELIMLDEATSGLDPIHAREVRELVASLSENITFILSSHDLSELERVCERVLFLQHGKLSHHHNHNEQKHVRHLTIRMAQDYSDFIAQVSALTGVIKVERTQDKEFVIACAVQCQKMDMALLQLCYRQQWQYKQLIQGDTLENQLFKS